jgi:hypothetical protein
MTGKRKLELAALAVVGVLVAACPGEEAELITCTTQAVSGATVLGMDTVSGGAGTAGCIGTVRLDSVGSDTTPGGTARTVYVMSSVEADTVASDTTP